MPTPDNPRRRRILDAALALFAECGCAGTPIPAIAERASVGAGTIYRHFDSKRALVNAVFLDAKTRLATALAARPHVLDPDATPRARFDDLWAGLVDFARAEPVAFHFLELQDHAPWLDDASRDFERGVLEPIHAACASLQQRGALRADPSAETLIAMIWGAFVGLFKAERLGYLTLDDTQLNATRDALWAACSP